MNEAALSKKTAHGPDAATMRPPNAGPIARAMLMPTPLSVIPAGSATRTTGRLPAVSTSATRTGEGVNEVINHDSPTSCIQVPTLEITVAIQSARNTDPLRGLHADALPAESFPLCFLVNVSFFADFATSGATPDRSAESCAGDAHLRRASRAKCAQSPKRPPPLSFAGRLRSYWHRCAVALSARL